MFTIFDFCNFSSFFANFSHFFWKYPNFGLKFSGSFRISKTTHKTGFGKIRIFQKNIHPCTRPRRDKLYCGNKKTVTVKILIDRKSRRNWAASLAFCRQSLAKKTSLLLLNDLIIFIVSSVTDLSGAERAKVHLS